MVALVSADEQRRLLPQITDDESKELSSEGLRNLGRALNEEYRQIVGGMNVSGKMNQIEIKITAMHPDDTAIKEQLWAAKDLASKCRTIGYGLQMNPPSEKKKRVGLRDECWIMRRQVAAIADEYEGYAKKLWLLYADWMARGR